MKPVKYFLKIPTTYENNNNNKKTVSSFAQYNTLTQTENATQKI